MHYNQQTAQNGLMATLPYNTILDKLQGKLSHLQNELHKTQEAIAALEANPDLVKIMDAIQSCPY